VRQEVPRPATTLDREPLHAPATLDTLGMGLCAMPLITARMGGITAPRMPPVPSLDLEPLLARVTPDFPATGLLALVGHSFPRFFSHFLVV